jgi:hypothetical protein
MLRRVADRYAGWRVIGFTADATLCRCYALPMLRFADATQGGRVMVRVWSLGRAVAGVIFIADGQLADSARRRVPDIFR